jgi:hypothetical protein
LQQQLDSESTYVDCAVSLVDEHPLASIAEASEEQDDKPKPLVISVQEMTSTNSSDKVGE